VIGFEQETILSVAAPQGLTDVTAGQRNAGSWQGRSSADPCNPRRLQVRPPPGVVAGRVASAAAESRAAGSPGLG
jgi:hypothetical protein